MFLFFTGLILLALGIGARFLMAHYNNAVKKLDKKITQEKDELRYGPSDKTVKARNENESAAKGFAILYGSLTALAIFFVVIASCTIVQPRSVKVPVTMGTTGDPMDSGFHFKSPLTKVIRIDTVEQVDNWDNGKDDTDHKSIPVKLADGSTANAFISLTWQINGEAASEVYSRYRSDDPTEKVYERLVAPKLKQAVQEVLGQHNPSIPTVETATDISFAPNFKELSDKVKANYTAGVSARGDFIEIVDLSFFDLDLDKSTQKRINQYREEIQKTKTAEQSVKTATEQAKANKILADSLKSQEGTSAYCFSLIEQGKLNPPVGFSCYPNAGNGNLILPGGATR